MTLLLVCRLGRVCSRWSWTQSVPQCSYFSVCFLIAKLTVAICATAAPQFRWALMITVGTHDHRGQLPCWEASIGMTSAKLINNNCHARSFYNMFKGNKVHNRNVQPPSFNISLLQTQKTTDISVVSPPLACNFIIVGLSSGYMQLAMADPAHMMHNCTIHNLTIYAAPWKKKKTPAQLRREPWLPVGGGSIGLTQGMVQGWVSSFTGCPGCSHCIFAALPLRIERGWRSTTGWRVRGMWMMRVKCQRHKESGQSGLVVHYDMLYDVMFVFRALLNKQVQVAVCSTQFVCLIVLCLEVSRGSASWGFWWWPEPWLENGLDLVQHVKRPLLHNNEDHEPTMPAEDWCRTAIYIIQDPWSSLTWLKLKKGLGKLSHQVFSRLTSDWLWFVLFLRFSKEAKSIRGGWSSWSSWWSSSECRWKCCSAFWLHCQFDSDTLPLTLLLAIPMWCCGWNASRVPSFHLRCFVWLPWGKTSSGIWTTPSSFCPLAWHFWCQVLRRATPTWRQSLVLSSTAKRWGHLDVLVFGLNMVESFCAKDWLVWN